MLTFYAAKSKTPVADALNAETVPAGVDWIDAYDPTAEERARLKKVMGVKVPTLDDLLEIETSSRLSVDDGALRMSLPVTVQDCAGYPTGTSIGFVVTPDKVATLRFADLPSFDQLVRRIGEKGDLSEGGFGATITIVEALVDQLADLLERVGGELDSMSRSIFADGVQAMNNRPHHSNRRLAGLLERVGRSGDLASKVSETLLGLSRMAPFIVANAGSNLTSALWFKIKGWW